jgi:quinol monooxygenase YgiN
MNRQQELITVGLYVRLEAKTGREEEVESFIRSALSMVQDEPDTIVWFGVRLGPSTFAIFDAFPNDEGRRAHLQGAVASALQEHGGDLLAEPPSIERFDILAARLPALAPTG